MKKTTFIQHYAQYLLCTLAMLLTFVGTAWGDTTIFSAVASTTKAASETNATIGTTIDLTGATITGGTMQGYITIKQSTKSRTFQTTSGRFEFGDNSQNFIIKLEGSNVIKAGDIISIDIYDNANSGNRGVGITSSPSTTYGATAAVVYSSCSADKTLHTCTYTVKSTDGIVGESTIYLSRYTENSTDFTNVKITRPTTSTTYNVSYDLNGHGDAIADVTGVTALPATLPTPTATGYTFGGWYTDEELTTAAVAGASISANTTLYAQWNEESADGSITIGRTLAYSSSASYVYSNGGNSDIAVSESKGTEYTGTKKSLYYKNKDAVELSAVAYRNMASDQSIVTTYNNDVYTGVKFEFSNGCEFTPTKVTAKVAVGHNFTYKVVVNNGTDDVYTSDDITVTNYSTADATNLDFTAALSGITLSGTSYIKLYYCLPDVASSKYIAPLELSLTGTTQTVTYSVTYDANGGETSTMPSDANSYFKNDEVTVLGSTSKKFKKWNTAADGSGTSYAVGDKFNITENTTLYAQWDTHIIETDPIGLTDKTTSWWTHFSPFTKIKSGETYKFSFTNYGGTGKSWFNWLLVAANKEGHSTDDVAGYAEYFVLRADKYGWGTNYQTPTLTGNYDNYLAALKGQYGAKVNMSIGYRNGAITVTSTTIANADEAGNTTGDTYTYSMTTKGTITADEIVLFHTVENAYLTGYTVSGPYHTVTYNLDDHGASTNVPTQDDVLEGGTFTTATEPTRFGYTFNGWSDGTNTYDADEVITMGNSDITLTALWTLTDVKSVALNGNGSELAGLTSIKEPYSGQAIVLPTGYTSDGATSITAGTWKKGDNSNAGTVPDWGQLPQTYYEYYTTSATASGANILTQTLSGLTNGTYEVVLRVGASWTGSDGFTCPVGNNLTAAFAQDKVISVPVIDRNGNTIVESSLQTVAFTVTVTDGTLTYGLKNVAASGNWFVAKVESIKKLTDLAVRKFAGWNTKADGTGTLYAAGSSYTATGDENETLYAKWDDTKYTVTFNGNGGTASTASLTEATFAGGVTLPTATNEGYTFIGWTTAQHVVDEAGVEYLAAGSTYYPTENCTLYAYYITNGKFIYALNAVNASNTVIKTFNTGVTDADVTAYYPKAFELDGKYYVTNATTYGATMTSTTPTANVTYALDINMVAFTEESTTTTSNNKSYSNGGYGNIAAQQVNCRGIDMGTIEPGKYSLTANIINITDRNIALRDVTGKTNTQTADIIAEIKTKYLKSGIQTVTFEVKNSTQLRINGRNADGNKSNQSVDFDYAYISHVDGILFTEQPVGTVAQQNEAVTLSASAVAYYKADGGYVTPSYQWYSNTTNSTTGATAINKATNTTYSPSTTADGIMYYYCVASYGSESVTSDIVKVEVNAAAFNPMDVTVALTDWDPTEPTQTGSLTLSNWTSLDQSIAKVDASGNIIMIKDGTTKITAQYTDASSNVRTVFYNLTITGEQGALDYTTPNTGKMKTIGKILEQPITEVSSISMTVGNASDAAVIRTAPANSSNAVSVVINPTDGSLYPTNYAAGLPASGTFYKFEPTANGTLTLIGYGSADNTPVSIVYMNGETLTTLKTTTAGASSSTTITAELTSGVTYYVTTTAGTNAFYLYSYSFATAYKFTNKAVTVSEAQTYTQVPVKNDGKEMSASEFTWSVIPKGDLASVSSEVTVNSSTGAVTWPSGTGGAIVVKAVKGNNELYYVITVPYTTHTWSFAADQWSDMSTNTTDWATTYKVRTYNAAKELTYINVPVVANSVAVNGDNAYFMSSTAGLLLNSPAKYFGSEATMKDDATLTTLEQKLNRPYTDATATNYLTIGKTTLTIPNLKAGQHIRLRWKRYSDLNGDNMKASNLNDLVGTEITNNFYVGNYAGKSEKAFDEFIVKEDGNVSLICNDNGFVHISEIVVGDVDEFIDTDYRLMNTGRHSVPSISVPQGEETATVYLSTIYGYVQCMSALTTKYEYELVDGHKRGISISDESTENGVLTINAKKNGQVKVIQKAYSNGYVLDYQETIVPITVVGDAWIEQTFTQEYPFSWDFTNISEDTYKNLQDAAYVKNDNVPLNQWTTWTSEDNVTDTHYGNRIVDDFIQGAALAISTEESYERLEEFQGLGVKSYCDDQIRISKGGNGLEFERVDDSKHSPAIIIPTVLEGYKVYIRGRWIDEENDIFSAYDPTDGTHTLTVTQMFDSNFGDDEQIYIISGCNGNDIEVALSGFQIRKIGVTNTFKKFSVSKDASYATDCQGYNVKYDLSSYFTNDNFPVSASIIKSRDGNIAKFTPIAIAGKGTGTILKCNSTVTDGTYNITNVPLFVRDVNSEEGSADGNMLVGVTEATNITTSGNEVAYIFTNKYYDTDDDGNPTGEKKTGEIGFYRLYTGKTQTLAANKSYLVIDWGSSSAKKVLYLWEMFEDDDATAINNAKNEVSIDKDAKIYNLQGVKVDKPTKGIYIVNGKKVVIK